MPPVTLDDAIEVFREVARNIESGKLTGTPSSADVAHLGEDEREEAYGYTVKSMVSPSVGCDVEKLVHRVNPQPYDYGVYGLDGSSRLFDSSRAQVAVLTAAVAYVDGGFVVATYPYDGVSAYIPVDAIVAAVGPPGAAHGKLVADRPIVNPVMIGNMRWCDRVSDKRCKAVKNLGYGRGYDTNTMIDENRILVETKCLEAVARSASSDSMIVVDGPLYATPGLYQSLARRSLPDPRFAIKAMYALSYVANSVFRVRVVVKAVSRGITVVGVVKRISYSRMLVHALKNCNIPWTRDVEIVDYLASKLDTAIVAVGPVYTIVKLKDVVDAARRVLEPSMVEYQKDLFRDDMPFSALNDLVSAVNGGFGVAAKKSYYLVVKGLRGPTVVRVELPCQPTVCGDITVSGTGDYIVAKDVDPSLALSRDAGILGAIAYYMLWPGPVQPAPLPIMVADSAASRLSKAVLAAGFSILDGLVTVSYETLMSLRG